MQERTCAECGVTLAEASGRGRQPTACELHLPSSYWRERVKYLRSKETGAYARKLAAKRAKYVPTPRAVVERSCEVGGCSRRHLARGLCSVHYKRARYAEGLDGSATERLVLHGVASLFGASAPKVKPVVCIRTIGLMVECPRCHDLMAGLSPHSRYCPSCWTTVELNPEEVSWVTSEGRLTRR